MQIKTGNADIVWRGSTWTTAGDLCQLETVWGSSSISADNKYLLQTLGKECF